MAKNAVASTEEGVADVILDCLSKSVRRTPVKSGDLRGSAYCEINNSVIAKGTKDGGIQSTGAAGETVNNRIIARVGYDAQTKDYSFVQHEHEEFNHPIGGESKFLEKTVVENEELWINHLKNKAVEGFREG